MRNWDGSAYAGIEPEQLASLAPQAVATALYLILAICAAILVVATIIQTVHALMIGGI